jgi:hypothetical protein
VAAIRGWIVRITGAIAANFVNLDKALLDCAAARLQAFAAGLRVRT